MTEKKFRETAPHLMPHQFEPFNNDYLIAEEFIKIRDKFDIITAVEGGTCLGSSTKFLAENFEQVITIEIVDRYFQISKQRLKHYSNVNFEFGSTVDLLPEILQYCDNRTIIFIDSHWNNLPLLDELEIIKESGLKPVIVIHDCKNPDKPELGFDKYKGVEISYETIKPYLEKIYGNNYDYYYNTGIVENSAKRGVIFITPK